MTWMIYGATGYTGKLIAEAAVQRGHKPVIAGRSEHKLKPLADRLGLDYLVFGVNDNAEAIDGLRRVDDLELVLHCAGPFIHTSAPMLEACLHVGAHYLDITGEISVFEHTFAQHDRAEAEGILLMSGVGFDIVPSDCLSRYVAEQKPNATQLDVVIEALGGDSGGANITAGTMKSMVEMIPGGGRLRRGGQLVPYDLGAGADRFTFPHGKRLTLPITWGDLSTAYRTTGIPNITTYMSFPPSQIKALQRFAYPLRMLLKNDMVRGWVCDQIDQNIDGPSQETRNTARSHLYARATAPDGTYADAWLETKEGYAFTVDASLLCVEQVLDGNYSGAQTPAQAFGADFVLNIDTTTRHDALDVTTA